LAVPGDADSRTPYPKNPVFEGTAGTWDASLIGTHVQFVGGRYANLALTHPAAAPFDRPLLGSDLVTRSSRRDPAGESLQAARRGASAPEDEEEGALPAVAIVDAGSKLRRLLGGATSDTRGARTPFEDGEQATADRVA